MVLGCFPQHGGADGIDAQTARKLDGRGRHKVLQGAVDQCCGRARSNRLPPNHPRGEGERSAIRDVGDALPHDLHLTEHFVAQTGEEISALKLLKRFERNGAHELKWLNTVGCITPNRITY